jgi:hypothetical protein
MEAQHDPIYNQVIVACESHYIKNLMGVHYDWNVEVIAKFYPTLYIEDAGGARRIHWMTEGEWYGISYDDFASYFPLELPTLTTLGFTFIIHLMRVR